MAVDQDQVDLTAQRQVLQPVVEQDRVDAETPERETTTLDAVAVDHDDHAERGEVAGEHVGFVAGLVGPDDIARTLSARYFKDGSEILISHGKKKTPRRLTPRECAYASPRATCA